MTRRLPLLSSLLLLVFSCVALVAIAGCRPKPTSEVKPEKEELKLIPLQPPPGAAGQPGTTRKK